MIERIRTWYRTRTNETKAALRTAGQSVVGATTAFLVVALSQATNILSGGDVQAAVDQLSAAASALVIGVLSALTGLVSYARNRWGKAKATYGA